MHSLRSEEHSRLKTRAEQNLHRAEEAEAQVASKQKQLLYLQEQLSQLEEQRVKDKADAVLQNKKLYKELSKQKKRHDNIAFELKNYK